MAERQRKVDGNHFVENRRGLDENKVRKGPNSKEEAKVSKSNQKDVIFHKNNK